MENVDADIIHSQNQNAMSIKEELVCNLADGSQRKDDHYGESDSSGDTTDKQWRMNRLPVESQYISCGNRGVYLPDFAHNFYARVCPKHGEDDTCHHTVQKDELPQHENTLRVNCVAAHSFKTDASDHYEKVSKVSN